MNTREYSSENIPANPLWELAKRHWEKLEILDPGEDESWERLEGRERLLYVYAMHDLLKRSPELVRECLNSDIDAWIHGQDHDKAKSKLLYRYNNDGTYTKIGHTEHGG